MSCKVASFCILGYLMLRAPQPLSFPPIPYDMYVHGLLPVTNIRTRTFYDDLRKPGTLGYSRHCFRFQ